MAVTDRFGAANSCTAKARILKGWGAFRRSICAAAMRSAGTRILPRCFTSWLREQCWRRIFRQSCGRQLRPCAREPAFIKAPVWEDFLTRLPQSLISRIETDMRESAQRSSRMPQTGVAAVRKRRTVQERCKAISPECCDTLEI